MSYHEPTRIDIPLGRLAWMLTLTMLPAGLLGWLVSWGWCLGVFTLGVVLSLSVASLAWGDHLMSTGRAQNNSLGLWLVFVGLPVLLILELYAFTHASFLGVAVVSAAYVACGTLLLTWLNLEGVSLLLLLVNALSAAGVAHGLGNSRLALAFGVGSLVLGILVSMVRGFVRARTDARR